MAMVILTVGVLAMASTTVYVVRQTTLGDITTERSVALQEVVERLEVMEFDSISTGRDSVGIYDVRWTSVIENPQAKMVTLITSGPGLAKDRGSPYPVFSREVADTFEYRVIRYVYTR